ncbi:MAG: AMP-binding protein [Acidimicrobiales bacterium]|jgi:fatty-acyl-CoA synthase
MSEPTENLHAVGRWITDRARQTPQRSAIEFYDRTITYSELDATSSELARSLLHHGLAVGDRVATLTENRPEHVALFFACAKAGLILTPLNWRLSAPEIAQQVEIFDPAIVCASATHRPLMNEACDLMKRAPLTFDLEQLARELGTDESNRAMPQVADDAGLLIIATSGTTGTPKGVVLTHANCFWTNVGFDLAAPMAGDDVVLQVLPQFHVGGWNVQPLLAWWKGATVVLEPSFEPDRVLNLIEGRRITTMMGVPATYLLLAQHPRFEDADLSSLRRVLVGGASMSLALIDLWQRRGVEVVQGYGLTEASPNVLCLAPEDARSHLGSVGKPYAYVEVSLHDDVADDFVIGEGRGEIYIKGPNVFLEYWNDPAATAAAFDDGWLRTGDVAERDDSGYYRICGRSKEMFISGGENVYPAEVEQVVVAFDNVDDAAVVAVAHPRWGETGVAFVVSKCDATLDIDELVRHCRSNLASYKVPSQFLVLEELPRTAVGKVDKKRLTALAQDGV